MPYYDFMGLDRIGRERQRQIEVEGWTAGHDDSHTDGELAKAAAAYIDAALVAQGGDALSYFSSRWPFGSSPWRPAADPIRNLEKAGALIAAEIDRLERVRQGIVGHMEAAMDLVESDPDHRPAIIHARTAEELSAMGVEPPEEKG